MIIANSECDYIMRNIKAVNALIESYELTKGRVPVWLTRQLTKNIEKRIEEFPSGKGTKWIVEEDENQIMLSQNIYYHNNYGYGVYYGIGDISWDCLAAENQEDGLWIYLYYHLPEKTPKNMKHKITDWEKELIELTENNRPYLLEKYDVFPDEGYLITYYLNEILDVESLGNGPENAIKNTIDSMIKFVVDTHKLLVAI